MLRDRDDANLREHLIATAARLIGERGSAGLSVREIAREAQVADGVLYNYFADKDDLLAQALLAHVAVVLNQAAQLLPPAGTATVADNLAGFIERGIGVLDRIVPAFAGLLSQPGVLRRFHALVGGDPAFTGAAEETRAENAPGPSPSPGPGPGPAPGERGLPDMLSHYLLAEQRLGRIDPAADVSAATVLIVGAIHGQVLPRALFAETPFSASPGLGAALAKVVLGGLAPKAG